MNKQTKRKNCRDKAKRLDSFGHSFQFLLPGAETAKRSWSGLTVTIICMILIIFYGSMNLIRLLEFGEPTIMVSVRDNYISADQQFTSNEGF